MSGFAPDYVPVSERIEAFYQAHPDGSIQCEISTLTDTLVVMRATVYRTPDDPRPSVAHSMLGIPGRTNFTRGSEVENAETSAVGRAIALLGFEVKRGMASREEVWNKQAVDPETGEIDATAQAGGGSAVSPRTSLTGNPDGRLEAVLNIIAHGYPEWAKDDKPLRAEATAAALGVTPSALTRESINPTIAQWLSGPGNSPATFASRFGEWFAAEQKRRAAREEVPA